MALMWESIANDIQIKRQINIKIYTVHLVFSPAKNGLKSVIYIFYSSVSVGNISYISKH